MNNPNWILIHECNIWRVLGVIECDNCPSEKKCWGSDIELPEPTEVARIWNEDGTSGVATGANKPELLPSDRLEV